MTAEQFKLRTQDFALRIIKLVKGLPRTEVSKVVGMQVLRSGTAVGANYRAACRSRSRDEFIARMGIVEEEIDETIYWLEILIRASEVKAERLNLLLAEAHEICAMVGQSRKTAGNNRPPTQSVRKIGNRKSEIGNGQQ